MARSSSSLLAGGSLKAWASRCPARVKKMTSRIRCATAPIRALTPTAATPALGGTPFFCRNRAFRAMPPTLAGETRLTNDEAAWVKVAGQNGTGPGTAPISAAALAR